MKALTTDPETAIHRMVDAAREGRDPAVVARVVSGWVLLGRQQFVRAYCLLVPDPVVSHLNALSTEARSHFMLDMSRVGDALLRITGAVRINYAVFGNVEPALHAHVIPRYADEPEHLRLQHPWAYDWAAAPAFDTRVHAELAESLGRELTRMGVSKPMRYAPGTRTDS
jgi:diadenosine tetraphosphate (Ap4A) HIT family hydrolase